MKQMRLNKIGFVQINLQLFTKLFFAVAAVGLLMAPAEKANAYAAPTGIYTQAVPGSGVSMGVQACPYGTKKANLGGSGNEDIRDANIRINNAKKDRTAARSAQRALNRDIDAVKRDIEEVLQGFASTQIISHIEGGYGCNDYEPTCSVGRSADDNELDGGPDNASFFEKLRYDISSLAISTADYISRKAISVARADDTGPDLDSCGRNSAQRAADVAKCVVCFSGQLQINQTCKAEQRRNQTNTSSRSGNQAGRGSATNVWCSANGGVVIPVINGDVAAANAECESLRQGGRANIPSGSVGGVGYPGRVPESRVPRQPRTAESTRCSFNDNLVNDDIGPNDLKQAKYGFCKKTRRGDVDLWERIIGDEDSASGIDIDALCGESKLRKRGESASDCKAAIQEYLDLREELRLAEQDEAAADALIRAQERLKRSLSREEAREARERARNGETEAGSPYCETGDCGDKKHYSPSASTIFGVAGALAGGLWASSEVNKQQDALAESAVRLGYNPQYYVNPNAAVNAGIGGAITLGSLAYGLAGGAYGCSGGLYPHGSMGVYGPNGMIGVDPTLGGAFGYPPWIYGGNPLGIPGMGGIASYGGYGALGGVPYGGSLISVGYGGIPGGGYGALGGVPYGGYGALGGVPYGGYGALGGVPYGGSLISVGYGGIPGGIGGYGGIPGGGYGGIPGGIGGYGALGGVPYGGYGGIPGGIGGYGSLAAAYGAAIAGGVAGGIAGGVAGGQYQQQLYQLQQQQYQLQIQQQQRAQQDYVQRMQTVNQLQGELYQIQARIQQIISGGGASAGFSINAGVTGNVGFQPTVGNTGGNVIPTNGGTGQPTR